jgi:hypothetical protein
MKCPAVLMIEGEAFPCDWPIDTDGRHDGWAHSSKPASAIWCGDEGPVGYEPEPDQIQGEVVTDLPTGGWGQGE